MLAPRGMGKSARCIADEIQKSGHGKKAPVYQGLSSLPLQRPGGSSVLGMKYRCLRYGTVTPPRLSRRCARSGIEINMPQADKAPQEQVFDPLGPMAGCRN